MIKITSCAADFKPIQRFEKRSSNDTLYVFEGQIYNTYVCYASSNFYAPDFYHVYVKDKDERLVWDGKDALFLDSLFSMYFISDTYHTLILNRVNNSANSNSQQLIYIDLKNGIETILITEGFYGHYGHLQNCNAVYYNDAAEGTIILDIEKQTRYSLDHLLKNTFGKISYWGLCPLTSCIVVITQDRTTALSIFHLEEHRVIDTIIIDCQKADQVSYQISLPYKLQGAILSINYANKAENGFLAHTKTEYFNLYFE